MPKVEKYLDQAQEALCQYPPNYESADMFFEKALKLAPDDCEVLDAYSEFLCEAGQVEKAEQLIMKSIQLQPEQNGMKYMYLAQIKSGRDSLECIERGVVLMKAQGANAGFEEGAMIADYLCSAYCMVAELYMTDLCDEPEAREACEKAFAEALRADPNSFDAHSVAATYHKSVGTTANAVEHVKQCLSIIEKADDPPPAEVRASLASTMIDLQMTEEACTVLHGVLKENEDEPRTWYLLGYANMLAGDLEPALECAEHVERIMEIYPAARPLWENKCKDLRQRVEYALENDPTVCGDASMI